MFKGEELSIVRIVNMSSVPTLGTGGYNSNGIPSNLTMGLTYREFLPIADTIRGNNERLLAHVNTWEAVKYLGST